MYPVAPFLESCNPTVAGVFFWAKLLGSNRTHATRYPNSPSRWKSLEASKGRRGCGALPLPATKAWKGPLLTSLENGIFTYMNGWCSWFIFAWNIKVEPKNHLVGGWTNPFQKIQKYAQVKLGIISPGKGENKKWLKSASSEILLLMVLKSGEKTCWGNGSVSHHLQGFLHAQVVQNPAPST